MAVEFGAKLYLKDNMYATLKKNLGLQREFSEQIDKTNASMQQMGRTRVNATINATDNASGVVESVRQTVNSVGNTTVSPEVSLQDNASGVIGAIQVRAILLSGEIAKIYGEISELAGFGDNAVKEVKNS